jgi:hypothetical protein
VRFAGPLRRAGCALPRCTASRRNGWYRCGAGAGCCEVAAVPALLASTNLRRSYPAGGHFPPPEEDPWQPLQGPGGSYVSLRKKIEKSRRRYEVETAHGGHAKRAVRVIGWAPSQRLGARPAIGAASGTAAVPSLVPTYPLSYGTSVRERRGPRQSRAADARPRPGRSGFQAAGAASPPRFLPFQTTNSWIVDRRRLPRLFKLWVALWV